MDGKQFDALARGLTAGLSRRRVVATMLGLAGAALVVDPTDAHTCRLAAQKCVRDAQCCSGTCNTSRTTRRSQRNRCVCQPNESACRGLCTDLAADEQNCGSCGVQCVPNQTCIDGVCICDDPKAIVCGDVCADITTVEHCGPSCQQCLPNQSCIDGECVCDDPNAIVCGDVCADITMPEHCGPSCEECRSGYTCDSGACTCGGNDCTDTQVCCNGTCTEVAQNDSNCGACGNVCGSSEICIAGKCWEKCTVTNAPVTCPWCINRITGEAVYVNNFNFNSNPSCASDSDCAAGQLCMAYFQNSTNANMNWRPGACMTAGICTP